MKYILLSQGLSATVSDCDYHYLRHWKWTANCCGKTTYAYRQTSRTTGRRTIYMHKIIAERKGLSCSRVDHVDGNGLNNNRSNIRRATQSQNGMNRGRPQTNRSGYKGVSRTSNSNRWRARITAGGREKQLGVFDTRKEAARAYDKAAIRLHGRFAHLNFPRAH